MSSQSPSIPSAVPQSGYTLGGVVSINLLFLFPFYSLFLVSNHKVLFLFIFHFLFSISAKNHLFQRGHPDRGRNPADVLQITLSNTINIAGSIVRTTTILITAPRAISRQRELIISILEYMPTPNVAAKKLKALTKIERTDV